MSSTPLTIQPNVTVEKEGSPAFILSDDEMEATIAACKWHIVLKFGSCRLNIDKIRVTVNQQSDLQFEATVSITVLAVLHSEDDCNKVLLRKVTWILSSKCKILRWSVVI